MKLSEALDYWVGAQRSAFIALSIAVLAKVLYYCCSGGRKKSKPPPPKTPPTTTMYLTNL